MTYPEARNPTIVARMAGTPVSLFVYLFIHPVTCNIGHVNYRLQFIYCNRTYNIWTSTQYNIINNNTQSVYVSSQKCLMFERVHQAGASDRSCTCAGHRCVRNFILDLSGSVLKWPSPENLSSTIIAHGANIRYQNLDLHYSVNGQYLSNTARCLETDFFYILILSLYFNLINF